MVCLWFVIMRAGESKTKRKSKVETKAEKKWPVMKRA